MAVTAVQRFKKAHPCPICGGFDGAPRGQGVRCHGFLSADGKFAHCSREEHAGGLPLGPNSATFAHRLAGSCKCGISHSPSPELVKSSKRKLVARHDYTDAQGVLLFQVVRYAPKSFRQRRPDGKDGWIWSLEGVPRVLYNLPALLKAEQVLICEGEKDCDLLASWNLAATCNPGGSGKWLSSYAEPLRGKAVAVVPDGDGAGRRHALTVASSLLGVAAEVRVIELGGGKDVSEWAARDGSRESLMRLVQDAEPITKDSIERLRTKWFPSNDAPERPHRLASLDALPGLWEVKAPEQPEVVKGLLGAGEVTLLAGKPGSGKSYVALGLALAVAIGKPFCGRETTRLRVLILDKENSPRVMRQRVDHLGGRAIPSEDLCFWGGWCGFAPEIGSPLVAEFAKTGGLIIVDSAIRFFEGKSENDSAEIARFFRPIIRLARMGGTLLVICHTGKGPTAQDYRGSSDYAAVADASFKLDRDGPLGEPLTTFALKITKSRSGSARALQGRLTDSGFFGGTSRPAPDEVFPSAAPPDPEGIRRQLVEAMDAKGVDRFSSDQAVEALDNYRITSAKQPASELADILQSLDISPKQFKIHGQKFRGYTLADLTKVGGVPGSSHPRGSPVPGTRYLVDKKGVSPEINGSGTGTEKRARYRPEESPKALEPEPQLPLLSDDDTEADYDESARYGWKNFP